MPGVYIAGSLSMHLRCLRCDKEIGQRQLRCLERQTHSETLVNLSSILLEFYLSQSIGRSGPAIPNVDGGIKV